MHAIEFSKWLTALSLLLATVGSQSAAAQNPEDANINAARGLSSIGKSDEDTISRWIAAELDACAKDGAQRGDAAWADLATRFEKQRLNSANTQQFLAALYVQAAKAAEKALAKGADVYSARGLAWILAGAAGSERVEVLPGLLLGLRSPDAVVRYHSASGLASLHKSIAADATKLQDAIAALREAGLAEPSDVVLGRIYEGLSFPPAQMSAVFDALTAILDKRLEVYRKAAGRGFAEAFLFEFLADPATGPIKQLTPAQLAQLVARVAVVFRTSGERYDSTELEFREIDALERMLVSSEELLVALAPAASGRGDVRKALQSGGYSNRAAVRAQVYLWIGKPGDTQPGALNAAPWNVPIGAP